MRICIGIEYDGSLFYGWQKQPSGNTIQDALEEAVGFIAGNKTEVVATGRTDAGVHAVSQIAHFDVSVERPIQAWVRGVNAHLPEGVAVLWAKPVADDFHARFSAKCRGYRYILLNHPVRPGLLSGKVGWCHQTLDVEKMIESSRCLIGEHDFSAFRAAECQAKSPVREIYSLNINKNGDFVIVDIYANAFLHHMVRNIVGSLVHVGKGKAPCGWISDLLQERNRFLAAPTFSPSGLYLYEVVYEDKWGLPGARDGFLEEYLGRP